MLDPCDACTQSQCASELDACLSDSSCFEGDGSGQYEQVIACVDATRVSQVVKRQDFIDCGNEVGLSGTGWPPVGMTTETTNLMNCIAMGQPNNNSWADSTMRSMVWPTNSCAQARLHCQAAIGASRFMPRSLSSWLCIFVASAGFVVPALAQNATTAAQKLQQLQQLRQAARDAAKSAAAQSPPPPPPPPPTRPPCLVPRRPWS